MDRAQTKREAILALADGTRTAREIAEMTGSCLSEIYKIAHGRLKLSRRGRPKGTPGPRRNPHRDRAIFALRRCGATVQEIGAQFSITHQRVCQILSRGIG